VYVQDEFEDMSISDGVAIAVACAWKEGLEPKWSHLSSWCSTMRKNRKHCHFDYADEGALCTLTDLAIKDYYLPMITAPSVGILRATFSENIDLENHAAKKIQCQFRAFRSRSCLRATKRRSEALDVQSVVKRLCV
jgi:hypothetical protein